MMFLIISLCCLLPLYYLLHRGAAQNPPQMYCSWTPEKAIRACAKITLHSGRGIASVEVHPEKDGIHQAIHIGVITIDVQQLGVQACSACNHTSI